MNKKWVCSEINDNKVKEVKEKNNLTDLVASILVGRNIVDKDKIKIFLNPARNDFYDPFLLDGMKETVDRLIQAIEKKNELLYMMTMM